MGSLLDTLGVRNKQPAQRRVELPNELVDPAVLAESMQPKRASFLDALLARSESGGRPVDFNGGFGEILGDAARGLITGGLTGRKPVPVSEEVARRRAQRRQEQAQAALQSALESGDVGGVAKIDPELASQLQGVQSESADRGAENKFRTLTGVVAGAPTPEDANMRIGALLQGNSELSKQFDDRDREIFAQGGSEGLLASLQGPAGSSSAGGGETSTIQVLNRIIAERKAAGKPMSSEEIANLALRLNVPKTFSNAGPGLFVSKDPTTGEVSLAKVGGGGTPSQQDSTAQAPTLGESPDVSQDQGAPQDQGVSQDQGAPPAQPQDLTSQVVSAEASLASAKRVAKNEADQLSQIQESSRDATSLLASFEQVQALLNAGIQTGPAEQVTLPVRKFLASLGAIPSEDANLTNQQALTALNNTLALQIRSPNSILSGGLPGAASDKDVRFLKESVPGLQQTREGNALIADMYRRRLNREIEKAAWMDRQFRKEGHLPSVDEQIAWAKSQPSIIPEAVRRTINDLTASQRKEKADLRSVFDSGFN